MTMQFATNQALKNADERRTLADSLRSFIRMYNPHEAREDTVLFPAFRKVVSKNEFASIGEDFAERARELFGQDGFESIVDKVAEIEKKFGIYDLSKFTPRSDSTMNINRALAVLKNLAQLFDLCWSQIVQG
jgi:DMSO/TMAO reductase YedYZ molybdopterin-dependent catalytic subunit